MKKLAWALAGLLGLGLLGGPAPSAFAASAEGYWMCVPVDSTHPNGGWCPISSAFPLPINGSISASTTAKATAAAPTYVEGSSNPLSMDLSGNLRTGLPLYSTPIAPATATATQGLMLGSIYNSTLPTFSNGQQGAFQVGSRGSQNVTIFGQDSNIAASVNGGSALTDGASNTPTGSLSAIIRGFIFNGSTWDRIAAAVNGLNSTGTGLATAQLVGQCDDTSPTGITENSFGNATIDCTTHAQYVEVKPSAASAAGITPVVTSAAASNLVLKAGAGNLYGFQVTSGASAGYVMVFNATSAPADGAVTPSKCMVLAANSTIGVDYRPGPPPVYSTGITVVFSTTGCFTKTASATAFISGEAQ